MLLPVVFFAAQYLFAPPAEIRSQKAVEEAQDRELAEEPALLAQAKQIWISGNDGWTWVFPTPVRPKDLTGVADIAFGQSGAVDTEASFNAMREAGGYRTSMHCQHGNTPSRCGPVSRHKVTLTGHRNQKVLITGIRARVLSETKAPLGSLVLGPPEGGGPVDAVYIDLDSPDKEAVTLDDRGVPGQRPFVDVQTRWAQKDEPLVFEVIAGTRKALEYRWELLVEVSYAGRTETVRIPADGGGFRTVGWDTGWSYKTRLLADLTTGTFIETTQDFGL